MKTYFLRTALPLLFMALIACDGPKQQEPDEETPTDTKGGAGYQFCKYKVTGSTDTTHFPVNSYVCFPCLDKQDKCPTKSKVFISNSNILLTLTQSGIDENCADCEDGTQVY